MSKVNEPLAIIIAAIIGLIGVFIGGYFVIRAGQEPFKLSLQATQTAEAMFTVIPPKKLPTGTPTPTKTPSPTPTPTATIDADPTVYDNFNNPALNGKWHTGLWDLRSGSPINEATQQDGVMIISQQGAADQGTALYARKFSDVSLSTLSSNTPFFLEAKLKLDPDKHAANTGNVHLHLLLICRREKDGFLNAGLIMVGLIVLIQFNLKKKDIIMMLTEGLLVLMRGTRFELK